VKWFAAAALPLVLAARPSLHVYPRVAAPGASVRVSGNADGCPHGDVVLILSRAWPGHGFAGIGTVRARVGRHGAFATLARVRRSARPGRYGITARCGGGNLGVIVYLRVT
jgi:hypothetical protein